MSKLPQNNPVFVAADVLVSAIRWRTSRADVREARKAFEDLADDPAVYGPTDRKVCDHIARFLGKIEEMF